MSSDIETALWARLLFGAGLKTYIAKQLLCLLHEKNLTLEEIIRMPSSQSSSMGFGPYQSALSQMPVGRPDTSAIRWNESLYPQGLHDLETKYKPALLFFSGALELLARPIIYLQPGELSAKGEELLPGLADILLDGSLLPAVFTGSPQENILIEQMSYSDGEVLIFVDQGLDRWTPSAEVAQHMHAGRIVALSPMPPGAEANPPLIPIIQKIGAAVAHRWVISSRYDNHSQYDSLSRSTLLLLSNTTPGAQQLPDTETAVDIADAIQWLNNTFNSDTEQSVGKEEVIAETNLPPISSEQALHILELGGKVPEALRQRLLGK